MQQQNQKSFGEFVRMREVDAHIGPAFAQNRAASGRLITTPRSKKFCFRRSCHRGDAYGKRRNIPLRSNAHEP